MNFGLPDEIYDDLTFELLKKKYPKEKIDVVITFIVKKETMSKETIDTLYNILYWGIEINVKIVSELVFIELRDAGDVDNLDIELTLFPLLQLMSCIVKNNSIDTLPKLISFVYSSCTIYSEYDIKELNNMFKKYSSTDVIENLFLNKDNNQYTIIMEVNN